MRALSSLGNKEIPDLTGTAQEAPYRRFVSDLQTLLSGFAEIWDRSFIELQRRAVDPLICDVLDDYHRLCGILHEFLFHVSRKMGELRSCLGSEDAVRIVDARYHVAQSSLQRSFQSLETCFHQFEFVVGRLSASDNFRLNNSLLRGRGLRRRCQNALRVMEDRLQQAADERAKEERTRHLEATRLRLQQLHSLMDDTVQRLIDLQERLHASFRENEADLRLFAGAKAAQARADSFESVWGETEEWRKRLAEAREASVPQTMIRLTSCAGSLLPIDAGKRFGAAATAGIITAAAACLARRRKPPGTYDATNG
jgi:exonuclease VII small subunit